MKSCGGGTKDENSESLLACNCNTCVSSLWPNNSGGEQKCGCSQVRGGDTEALIQNGYQATQLILDGLSSDEGEGHSKSSDSDDFDPQWVFLFHDDTDIDKEWCFMEIRSLKSIFCCGWQWMWWEPDCCLWWEDGMIERNQTCLWGLFFFFLQSLLITRYTTFWIWLILISGIYMHRSF